MSKRSRGHKNTQPITQKQSGAQHVEAFTFGDPIPMLDRREILDYLECSIVDRWYEPPISFSGLAKTFRAAVHHSSPITMKRNILVSMFKPHRLLSKQDFSRYAQVFMVFGNSFIEGRYNRLGGLMKLAPSLAKYTRRGVETDSYWFVQSWMEPHQFADGSIFHLLDPDINQEIYGVPEYLSSLTPSG